jgi:hypothetical protein
VVAPVDLGRLSLFLRIRFQGHGVGLETREVSVGRSQSLDKKECQQDN